MRNVIARSRKAKPATSKAWWWQSLVVFLLPLMLALSACGDDNSNSAAPDGVEPSSSSVTPQSSSSSKVPEPVDEPVELVEGSSCSEKAKSSSSKNEESLSSEKSSSSSSVILSASEESSSSLAKSSFSVAESSSSVVTPQSSSSSTSVSSSSAGEVNCSALLEGETGWNWDVPKECRFNPSIGYGSMTDERDGKVYKTVEIGDQVWMAENLNYYDTTDVNVKEKGSCYGKKGYEYSTTCDVAGRLYTWAAAMGKTKDECGHDCDLGTGNVQGICPSGWHIPTYAEWEALFTAVGGQSAAGKILKSQTGWYGGNGTDVFGFSALPAGYKDDLHFFFEAGYDADFWSATERDSVDAYFMCLYHEFSAAYLRYSDKDYFFSVRCVKNN